MQSRVYLEPGLQTTRLMGFFSLSNCSTSLTTHHLNTELQPKYKALYIKTYQKKKKIFELTTIPPPLLSQTRESFYGKDVNQ